MTLENYPGNKGFAHAKIEITNLIPPHIIFMEAFAGSASIAEEIYTGQIIVLNDINDKVYRLLKSKWGCKAHINNIDALFLVAYYQSIITAFSGFVTYKDLFIYCDLPYPKSSRRSSTDIYEYEMTDDQHRKFLSMALKVPFNCMISSYPNEMYDTVLKDWNRYEFQTSVHGNPATEVLYFNYDFPTRLHTYKNLGKDCWERQRINRKVDRILQKFSALPDLERNKLISELNQRFES